MITIIRRYYNCNFLNSSTFEVELEITLRIVGKPEILLLPAGSYRGDLKITKSDGKECILLSDKEFERKYQHKMSEIKEKYIEKLLKDVPANQKNELFKNHRVMAILLERNDDEYYEKITMKWVTQLGKKKATRLNEFVEIPMYFQRYGFLDSKTAAIYLSIKTSDKYQIMESLQFNELISDSLLSPTVILNEKRHKIYRLKETNIRQMIQTIIKISLPDSKIHWAKLGVLSAIITPLYVISLFFYYSTIPIFGIESIAAVIVLIIGQRAFLFHDLHLMFRWNYAHLAAVVFCSLVIAILIAVEPTLPVEPILDSP